MIHTSSPASATRVVIDRAHRINHSDDAGPDGPTRSLRVAHHARHGYTLCGRRLPTDTTPAPADPGHVLCADCAAIPTGHLTHRDLTNTGISYRQLDYWVRRGWLRPDLDSPGSVTRRTFPADELSIARVMAALTAAGLDPEAAHRVARGGQLAPGITITLEETR